MEKFLMNHDSLHIIDRFPKLLSEDEANTFLNPSFIRFDKNDLPIGKHAERDIKIESQFINGFYKLYSVSNFSIKFDYPLKDYFKKEKWKLKCLTKNEKRLFKSVSKEFKGLEILNPSKPVLELLVKLSCRDLFFSLFGSDDFEITGSYEMCFVVRKADKKMLNIIKDIFNNEGLFVRKAVGATNN